MEYKDTPHSPNPYNIDPHLYMYSQSVPDVNPVERNRHPNHGLPPPITRQIVPHLNVPLTRPTSPLNSSQPRLTDTQPPINHARTPTNDPPTSSLVPQSATASLPPPQAILRQRYPPVFAPARLPTVSRPVCQQKQHQQHQHSSAQHSPAQHYSSVQPLDQETPSSILPAPKRYLPLPAPQNHPPSISSKPTSTLLPRAPTNPDQVLHTLLPPKNHIVRANTPIRPFILSLPLGTPFHKRYKALLLFTRTHGSIVQSTFLAGPYFSYRDPANNQIHFLINDILVPEGRWADELSYKVQVMESGLGVLDKDRRTWGNHWRETREEKEGVVAFEGGSKRSVVLFWYGDNNGDSGEEGGAGMLLEDNVSEEGRWLLEEGVWGWVN
ncbi:hypothetical protein QBC36DRAFT_382549 [Triangularia setosa]|uniref:Uncharacterized protein n=1 Tax=Triangularia setosa TaxID=2587417 RepID=A0AAN7A2C0_9PEZI|nr:hypothetical protein QBC36DRAFT_382549 [Podospora setosa]